MRDLTGYGGRPPQIVWPNGARVAVSLVVNYEEGAEQQVSDGDTRSEPMGEVISVVEPGVRDLGQEQIFAYGMRVGLWRFLDTFDRRGIAATFFCCGRAVERTPELAAEITRRGHEAACHGWRWRPHSDYPSREAESTDLDRAVGAIAAATGERPVGFFCRGSESVWTRDLLQERGFLYTSNAFDDDLPYREAERPGLLIVPYALDTNDMKFFHPNGFVRAREMVEYVEDALKQLVEEARESGRSSILNIGFHLRICGRPARFRAVEGILDALDRHKDRIWITRRDAIARHFAAHHPDDAS
ncbi:polysaccharide deacetylase family protein [Jiella marina]|uniref:polysaccharide deacetylase family protein n=1 Tax=Jiella sp. LLJ827 TaxID=2917712 RepID=UPI0021018B05|nr:polysaccharide deacetylase family protein [Jiella sp. LLJ827]MCQ0986315.1 polysaccharide deacetylase family protein [Jiella sp. LLJ827]